MKYFKLGYVFNLVAILLSLLIFTACSSEKQDAIQSQSPVINVSLDFQVIKAGNMKVKCVGETNLPDGMELGVSIEGKTTNFIAQSDAVVKNKRFESEVIGPEKGMVPGQYVAYLSSPMSMLQPEYVRAVIGEQGEKLKGKAILKEDDDARVGLEKSFQLKADGSIVYSEGKEEIAATKEKVRKYLNKLKKFESLGRSLDRARETDDPECMRHIQDRKKGVQTLRDELEHADIPFEYTFHLKVAATELSLCVVCSNPLASEGCDRAKNSIEEVEKLLR